MSMFGNQQPIYGNPYPQRYQQPMQGYYPQPMAAIPQQQTQASLIQVNGVEGAKAYPLAANAEVALFDAGRDVFYVKRTDAGGYPTIAAYQFTPLQETPAQPSPEYVTRQEFDQLKEMIENGIKPVRKAKQTAAADPDE